MKNDQIELLSILKTLPIIPNRSLCDSFSKIAYTKERGLVGTCDLYSEFKKILSSAYIDWEHYSGIARFPVNHPDYTCGKGYYYSIQRAEMNTGEYGRRRRELLQRMIDILTLKLDSEK